MSKVKHILNSTFWQATFNRVEMARRRSELVAWLEAKYDYYMSLAETAAWTDQVQCGEYFQYARSIRLAAEQIATPGQVSDHKVNLMYLGEIEVDL